MFPRTRCDAGQNSEKYPKLNKGTEQENKAETMKQEIKIKNPWPGLIKERKRKAI